MKRLPISQIAAGFVALAAWAPSAMAATETVLYSFPDSGTGEPLGTLHFKNGSLYGTGSGDEKSADGQVFKLTNSNGAWKETTLLTFEGANGSTPFTGPMPGADGVFYGTTAYGDAYNGGNVYALHKSGGKWVSSTIWAFGGTAGDGTSPDCDLVMDKSGNIFGTTFWGGTANAGTVFELSNVNGVWTETVLYSFTGQNGDGWFPYAGLLMAGSGTFYGTTQYGGNYGNGAVFKLFKSAGVWKEKVIYGFSGADGYEPLGTLIRDKNGALYGTTKFGGATDEGVVFMLSPSAGKWTETTLHEFDSFNGDAANPIAGLTWGPSGSLYGTTTNGGDPGSGIVFELTQSGGVWTETILHRFGNKRGDGGYLQGGVTLDENGALYGMTAGGGKYGYGTVWKITP
ncbi:MAG TPA: choice-of-anchor tandem repeat GloVer-containing protein [Rhizomicrobium sp.]|jgi:uncharacterized repeat protein (TIGR03803 family)|nr:choice-of-anchor tandem repeat GloVer-containing protein [Rhizomicrobium sp.]